MRTPQPSSDPTRAAAEQATIDALRVHDFRAAATAMAAFEARQPVPRGIGVEWRRYNPARDVFALSVIFAEVPPSVGTIAAPALEPVRIGAGMMYLWGVSKPRRIWLSRELDTGTGKSADEVAVAFVLHAYGKLRERNAAEAARLFAR